MNSVADNNVNEVHASKKLVKISDKCEVFSTKTMYNGKKSSNSPRDSGCYTDDVRNDDCTKKSKPFVSSKILARKANEIKKKYSSNPQNRRIHSKSCSHASDVMSDFEFQNYDIYDDEDETFFNDSQESAESKTLQQLRAKKRNKKNGIKLCWGEPGCEMSDNSFLDKKDPNYDSQDENFSDFNYKMGSVKINDQDFESTINTCLTEYFDHSDPKEVENVLVEIMPNAQQISRFIYLAISAGLEKRPVQREMISILLSSLYDLRVLTQETLISGFLMILNDELIELVVDLPDAPELIGCFVARAVADDLIPPVFVYKNNDLNSNEYVCRAMHKASALLHAPHAYSKLDSVWIGPAGLKSLPILCLGPTRQLAKAFKSILKEFFDANDFNEVERTLRELDSPHFLHEFVFIATQLVCEIGTEVAMTSVTNLLKYLFKTGQLTSDMIYKGIRRVFNELADFSLDVPTAYLSVDRFLKSACSCGFIGEDLLKEMPIKKRSRFISECVVRNDKPFFDDSNAGAIE